MYSDFAHFAAIVPAFFRSCEIWRVNHCKVKEIVGNVFHIFHAIDTDGFIHMYRANLWAFRSLLF